MGTEKPGRGSRTAQSRRRANACRQLIFSMSGYAPAYCQQSASPPALVPEPEAKRIFWIIPNFRTLPVLVPYKPITARQKFHIATLDSFDSGTFAFGTLFGAEAQLTRAAPSFGQGVLGCAHYSATAFADYMTEAIFPSCFARTHDISAEAPAASGLAWVMQRARSCGPTATRATDSSMSQKLQATPQPWRSQWPTTLTTVRLSMLCQSLAASSVST